MPVHRHVTPFQWTPAPPRPSPGRNDPSCRIGSDGSDGLWRNVSVSRAGFCINALRTAYFSSSRINGIAKSGLVERMPPRSNATTRMPASLNSFARMPPVHPRPTMTTSTSLKRVAIGHLRKIENALWFDVVRLVAIGLDVFWRDRDHAGKTDHLPRDLVAIAAVHRIGEEALHCRREQQVEEFLCGDSVECNAPLLHVLENRDLLIDGQTIEILLQGLAAIRGGCGHPCSEKLRRRQR